MESKVKVAGHAVHPMLIVFPLGLLATAAVFDIIALITSDGKWSTMAWYMIAAGIIGGLLAALFGLIDWLAIPRNTRAKAIGLWHGGLNVLVVLLFALSWLLRRTDPATPGGLALTLSFSAVVVALLGGWLGGELVERLGVGVDEGANLNAPNSLSKSKVATSGRSPVHRVF
jgi:uncharacterized membrane protein